MFFANEVRSTEGLTGLEPVEVDSRELTMALALVENLSSPFAPEKYGDQYREALLELIEQKIQGKEVLALAEPPKDKVVDLMAALEASLQATTSKEPALRS
jgi:DNA end-binding protein Ku